MNNYLVSVIVPIFNVEQYIRKCLDSIKNQSYIHYEVLMINDGSPDRSGDIAKEYLTDKRFLYFEKENGGISSVRNYGIKLAKGKYVCFIDSDDYVEPNYLEELIKGLGDSDIAICYFTLVNKQGILIPPKKMFYKIVNPLDIWDVEGISLRMIDVPWNKIYKKEIIQKITYPYGQIHEDSLTISELLTQCRNVSLIGKSLYYYTQREDSLIGVAKKNNSLEKFDVYFQKIIFLLKISKIGLATDTCFAMMIDVCFFRYNSAIYKSNKKDIKAIVSQSKIICKSVVYKKLDLKRKFKILIYVYSTFLFYLLTKKSRKRGGIIF